MYRFLFSILSFFILSFSSFALTWFNISTGSIDKCKQLEKNFSIQSPDIIKTNFPIKFYVSWITGTKTLITWSIYKNWNKVFSKKINELVYIFNNTWEVILEAKFKIKNCDIVLDKNILVFDKIILTILSKNDISWFISTLNLKNKWIFLKNISTKDLETNSYLLQIADYVIINQDNVINFFSLLPKNKIYTDKKFVLLIDSFRSFFAKLIIPYVKWVYSNNIYIYSSRDLLNILWDIYQSKQLDSANLLTTSSVWNKWYFPLSYFVNKLIEHWIDVNILAIVIIALLWTILVAFFRQFIGFSVFWVYTPLIFSIMYITLWFKLLSVLFVLAILAQLLTYIITKKIYILYASKISLTYIIYVIISIVVVGLLIKLGLFTDFKVDNSVVLAYFIMPLLTKNLVKEETSIFSRSFWVFIIEFVFIVSVLLILFHVNFLKYLLVAYPDLLWFFIIIVILIGRFTWLQLLEYIRFYPLIKKSLHEEE